MSKLLKVLELTDEIVKAWRHGSFEQQRTAINAYLAEMDPNKPPTLAERLDQNLDHDERSEKLFSFIADLDYNQGGDSFCFKSGGDGDNGEMLMYLLDCWFANQDMIVR